MAKYTLNNIINLIEAFKTAHLQLRSFYFGRLPDSQSEQDIQYPSLLAELQPSPIKEKEETIKFGVSLEIWLLKPEDSMRCTSMLKI